LESDGEAPGEGRFDEAVKKESQSISDYEFRREVSADSLCTEPDPVGDSDTECDESTRNEYERTTNRRWCEFSL